MFPFWWFWDPHVEEHIPKKDRIKSTLTLYNHSGLPFLLHLTTNPWVLQSLPARHLVFLFWDTTYITLYKFKVDRCVFCKIILLKYACLLPSIQPTSSPSHRVFFHLGTWTCLLTDLSGLRFSSVTDPPHGSLSHPSKPPSFLATFLHETFSGSPTPVRTRPTHCSMAYKAFRDLITLLTHDVPMDQASRGCWKR